MLVSVPPDLGMFEVHSLVDSLGKMFPKVRFLVLREGVKLSVLDEAEKERILEALCGD